nr:glycerol kinase [Deltaproteobacteria bacterium]
RAGTLDTWLVDRLTNGAVFATDASTAARTLLCDIATATWSAELCALFAIPLAILAEIRDTDAGFGACAGHGLDGVPIVASIVDQPAALMGQGCVEPGEAKATFGTGCFVYVNAGQVRPAGTGTLATIAWRRDGVSTYALDGGVLAVGSALSWLSELGLGDTGDLSTGARRERHDAGVTCVPALVGLGAPHWDRAARGAWLGISNATTRADLAGAFVEGLACRVVEVIDAIEADAGLAIAELHVDGGLTRAPALMQLQADLLGRPVVVAEEDEATVVGACAIAALRLGLTTLADVHARRTRSRRRFEPVMSADERAATLLRFRRAIALVRQWG